VLLLVKAHLMTPWGRAGAPIPHRGARISLNFHVGPATYLGRSAADGFRMGQVIPKAYIVYCDGRTLLDRREYPYPCTQEMQREYPDYKTSLGPWSEADIMDFFTVDYGRDELRWTISRRDIADFFLSGELVLIRRWPEPDAPADGGRESGS
jgi:hypothetical protein